MWTAALTLLKNPKNLFMTAMTVAILVLLTTMTIQAARHKVTEANLTQAKSQMTAQAAQLEQYGVLVQAIKDHDERISALTAETRKTTQAIAGLKIEGRCVKDESYYRIADDISDRFNRVREAGD